MKRDVGYALFAALSLSALTALWALINAPSLANPKEPELTRGSGGSVPVLPRRPNNAEALDRAVAVLETRDLFSATAPADMASLRRLSKAQIAPPVELTPVEDAPPRPRQFSAAPPIFRPAPAPQQQTYAPPLPQSPPPPPQQRIQRQPIQPQQQPQRITPPVPTQQGLAARTIRDQRFPLTLRGVFPDRRTGGRAHVALPNGQIVSTGPGGVIEGFYVLQINAASIIVQGRGGPALRLEMPGY